MHTITLEDVPEEVYQRVLQRAERNHRSVSGEIISCVEAALGEEPPNVDEILAQARAFRKRIGGHLTEEQLNAWKREGRL